MKESLKFSAFLIMSAVGGGLRSVGTQYNVFHTSSKNVIIIFIIQAVTKHTERLHYNVGNSQTSENNM